MDIIVRTIAKGLFPFIILLGVYILFHGHLTPGGSFPGGTIMAAGIFLVAVAFGLKRAEGIIKEETAHVMEALVALALASIVFFESVVRGLFVPIGKPFEIWSAHEILFLNIFGGIMVTMALVLVIFLLMKE
jgi:multicomponent Na+:H+ antiporter subunit B